MKAFLAAFMLLILSVLFESYAGTPAEELEKKQDWTIPDLNIRMVYVEPGIFMMGSPSDEKDRDDNETQHKVTITRGYWICKYEVKQREYEVVMKENPSSFKGDALPLSMDHSLRMKSDLAKIKRKDCPVESANWNDAVKFCGRLNEMYAAILPQGYVFRLPTEAEWEFAAKGGVKGRGFKYSGGDNLAEVAWYSGNAGGTPHETGRKSPNELGICDMSGNVSEWCLDWYGNHGVGDQKDPLGAEGTSSYRVTKGGAWDGNPRDCRPADRDYYLPESPNINIGFRVALGYRPD